MLKKLAIAGALLATFAGAHAQQTAPFGVTGTVTPGTCAVTLTGGGIVDYGAASQVTVKTYRQVTGSTILYGFPDKFVPININCSAPTKVAVSFVDNKSAQRIAFNTGDAAFYGLGDGTAGTTAIGFYQVQFINVNTDSLAVGQILTAANGSATFSTTQPVGAPNNAVPGRTMGFARTAGAAVPEAFTTLAGTLTFQTYVSKPLIDGAATVVTPTGSGTLTLVYL